MLGETYRLRASGTFVVSTAGALADAEYWDFPSMLDGVSGVDLGIAIDDPVVDTNRTPKWGTYDPSHVYQVDFVGKGAVIDAGYHDGNFSNNMGTLTLDVFRFQ